MFPVSERNQFQARLRGKPLFEAAFRIEETGRVRLAVLKLPAKETVETPDS